MLDSFSFKLLLTFLVGSSVVTLATVAAEKFGSKVGGFIAGLPSTAAIGLFFIGLAQSPKAASEATDVIPLIFGFNGLFLVTYPVGARWGTAIGLTGALMVWMSLTLAAIFLDIRHFGGLGCGQRVGAFPGGLYRSSYGILSRSGKDFADRFGWKAIPVPYSRSDWFPGDIQRLDHHDGGVSE